jgi:bidirectional [NiFe] hydrogenase diaphorase subunit
VFFVIVLRMLSTIIIDNKEIKARHASNLLWTALDNGFYIPNLCTMRDVEKPFASCRLCFVEIKGQPRPVTACTQTLNDGMVISLTSPAITRLRKTAFNLLLSNHNLDCSRCMKNRHCELQHIAHILHIKMNDKQYKKIYNDAAVDSSHPEFVFDTNKCILCGRCVYVCHKEGKGVLDFAYRGIHTVVSTFAGIPLSETECNSCGNCIKVCPVGALYNK